MSQYLGHNHQHHHYTNAKHKIDRGWRSLNLFSLVVYVCLSLLSCASIQLGGPFGRQQACLTSNAMSWSIHSLPVIDPTVYMPAPAAAGRGYPARSSPACAYMQHH